MRRNELQPMVRFLGCPDFFVTFSTADLHWDSLMRLYSPLVYQRWKDGDEQVRLRTAREGLRDNPQIAATHFVKRSNLYLNRFLVPKFGIIDHWFRYEWQARGSPHIHGFWINKDFSRYPPADITTPECREALAGHLQYVVEAVHHFSQHLAQMPRGRDPVAQSPDISGYSFLDLAQLLQVTQYHTCNEQYCLRKKKGSNEVLCRFYFPRPVADHAHFTLELNTRHWTFAAIRNDEVLNQYNRAIALSWRANHDITPCGDTTAVISYMGKYCAKAETSSMTVQSSIKSVIPFLSNHNPHLSLFIRSLNRVLSERDISGQELQHYISDALLYVQ